MTTVAIVVLLAILVFSYRQVILVVGDTGADAGFGDGAPVYGWPGPGGCWQRRVRERDVSYPNA